MWHLQNGQWLQAQVWQKGNSVSVSLGAKGSDRVQETEGNRLV